MSSSPSSSFSSDVAIAPASLQPLHDVVCAVDVLLGSASMTVRDVLQLQAAGVLRLNQLAGADMLVTVNGIPVAHGEVVIVEDSTAIRITEVLSPPSGEVTE